MQVGLNFSHLIKVLSRHLSHTVLCIYILNERLCMEKQEI
jgi:hypothetical protein